MNANTVLKEAEYKTSLINNRRYLGNKYKLLPFITDVVKNECHDIKTFADIFAGTGAVSSAFTDKIIITNDLMYSNYICNYAWFGSEAYNPKLIIDYVVYYNSLRNIGDNYMTENFADTYFSREDCAITVKFTALKTTKASDEALDETLNRHDDGLYVGLDVGLAEKTLKIISENPKVTMAEIANECNVTKRTVERTIKALREQGKIVREGGKRYGHWKVI